VHQTVAYCYRRETGMLFNRSITTQFTIVFVVALLLVVGSFYLVLDSVYRNEPKSQAETVADNVDAFGSWVSQYGRVWVRDDNKSYLGQVTLVSAPDTAGGPAAADVWHFYSKNPALAQREFSEVVEKSASPAKFRVTSHNFMNPVNKPDAFEAKALERIRAQHLAEYYEMSPDSFRSRARSTWRLPGSPCIPARRIPLPTARPATAPNAASASKEARA